MTACTRARSRPMAAWSAACRATRSVFMVFTLANVGLPGTSGFVGEFLTLIGAFQVNTWVALFATTGVILSAAYALYLYRRVHLRRAREAELLAMPDLTSREIAVPRAAAAADHLLRRASAADHRRQRRFDRRAAAGLQSRVGCDDDGRALTARGARTLRTDENMTRPRFPFRSSCPSSSSRSACMALLLVGAFRGEQVGLARHRGRRRAARRSRSSSLLVRQPGRRASPSTAPSPTTRSRAS